jgi:hypothetical protein
MTGLLASFILLAVSALCFFLIANKRVRSFLRLMDHRPTVFFMEGDGQTTEGSALAILLIGAVTSLVLGLAFLIASIAGY